MSRRALLAYPASESRIDFYADSMSDPGEATARFSHLPFSCAYENLFSSPAAPTLRSTKNYLTDEVLARSES